MAGEQHPFSLPREGVGDEGTPQGGAPASPPGAPPTTDQRIAAFESTVESLKPLTIFAEALKDPAVQKRVIDAFTGAGAAPRDASAPQGPTLAEQETAIKAKYAERRKAAIANADFDTAFALSSEEGAEIGELRSTAKFAAQAGNIVGMTAQNSVESWAAAKAATSPLFSKLRDKFFEEFNRWTSPQDRAAMAAQGNLLNACELTWNRVVTQNYEPAYNKTAVSAPPPAQNVPPYSMGSGGGALPPPDTPSADDKDDDAFREWAAKNNINISLDGSGALIGEIK